MAEIGSVIDHTYQLVDYINRGGMSVVYLAVNVRLGNRWAVKEITKTEEKYNRLYIDALIREANIMKDFDYPAFPRIVDIIEDDTALYLVMDYIEGKTLEEILFQEGPQPEERVIDWGIQLCGALAYLHNRTSPIIYRDMKPSNVILKADGSLRVIDFGVARVYNPEKEHDTVMLGTKGFAPPEQYIGQTDERSDIYALGATMRCLLTGITPYSNEYIDYPAVYAGVSLSQKMIFILNKCTSMNPDERFQTCEDLCDALLDKKKWRPSKAAKKSKAGTVILIVLVVALLIGGAALAYSLLKEDKKPAEPPEAAVSQTVYVPDVVGKPYEEARAMLEKSGLICEKVESYSANEANGNVVAQYIKPGERIEKGSVIKLVVSCSEKVDSEDADMSKETEAPDDPIITKNLELDVDMPKNVNSVVKVMVLVDGEVDENNCRNIIPSESEIYTINLSFQDDTDISVLINGKEYRDYHVNFEKETVDLVNAYSYSE